MKDTAGQIAGPSSGRRRERSGLRDPLLRHGLLLVVASQVGNVSNLLFQVVMMRGLGTVEYGVLSSLLALVLIVGTPSDALRTAVAHATARLLGGGRAGEVRPVLRAWLRLVALAAAVLAAAVAAGSPAFAAYLRIDRPGLVVLAGLVMAAMLFVPLVAGALQGMERFGRLAVLGQVPAVVRLAIGAALVLGFGSRAGGALGAQLAGLVLFVLVAWRVVPGAVPPAGAGRAERPAAEYFARSLFILLALGVLMGADVSLVKHYFDAERAGLYARAATMARAIVFLPGPIALALFPKVVSTGARSREAGRLLVRAALYASVLIGAAAAAGTLLAPWLWRGFTGEPAGPEALRLTRAALWAMAPLGLVHLLTNFEMAQNRFAGPACLFATAALYVGGVALWHARLTDVLLVLAAVGILSAGALAVGLRGPRRRDA